MTEKTDDVVEELTPEQKQQAEKDAAAGFEAGFKGARGEEVEPAKPKKKDEKPTQSTAEAGPDKEPGNQEAVVETAPDPYEGLSPAVRDQLAALAKLPDRLRNIEGHIGGLKTSVTALSAAKAATERTGAEAPTSERIAAASGSTEKWKQLETDFPEWTDALNERLTTMSTDLAGRIPKFDVESVKKDVVGAVTPMLDEVRSEARQLARIDMKHDGWEDTVKTPAFGAWLTSQTPDTQTLAESTKASDAIKLLDTYEVHRKAAQKAEADRRRKQERLAGAVTPQGTAESAPTAVPDEEGFSRGFKKVSGARL